MQQLISSEQPPDPLYTFSAALGAYLGAGYWGGLSGLPLILFVLGSAVIGGYVGAVLEDLNPFRRRSIQFDGVEMNFETARETSKCLGPEGIDLLVMKGLDFMNQQSRPGGAFSGDELPPLLVKVVADVERVTAPGARDPMGEDYKLQEKLSAPALAMIHDLTGGAWKTAA